MTAREHDFHKPGVFRRHRDLRALTGQRVYSNSVVLCGDAVEDARLAVGAQGFEHVAFLLQHQHVAVNDGDLRATTVNVFCPLHLQDEAMHVHKGDNVYILGRLRVSRLGDGPSYPEIVASCVAVLKPFTALATKSN